MNDISLYKNYGYVCVGGRARGKGVGVGGKGGCMKLFINDCGTHMAAGRGVGVGQ